jgi:peroxiredoxin family protein
VPAPGAPPREAETTTELKNGAGTPIRVRDNPDTDMQALNREPSIPPDALEELRARVTALEQGQSDYGVSLLVFSGELDRLMAAFTVAVGSASCGARSAMFFTFWGAAALKRHGSQAGGKSLVERIFGWLLPGGIHRRPLSRLDMAGVGRAILAREMRRKRIADLPELIAMAANAGVEIYFCEMSMDLMGIRKEELIDFPGARYCGVAHFLDLAARSRNTLFI